MFSWLPRRLFLLVRAGFVLACASAFTLLAAGWWALHLYQVATLDAAVSARQIRLSPSAEAAVGDTRSVTIGYRELLQEPGPESAEAQHLRVIWRDNGQVEVQHFGSRRHMGLVYSEVRGGLSDRNYILHDGDEIRVGQHRYQVSLTRSPGGQGQSSLLLREGGQPQAVGRIPSKYFGNASGDDQIDWISDGLSIGGRIDHNPASWGEGWSVRALATLLLKGGHAPPVVVRAEGLPENALRIEQRGDLFILFAQGNRLVEVCPRGGTQGCVEVGRQLWPVDGDVELGQLQRIILGRTIYTVQATPEAVLVLTPVRNGHWVEPSVARQLNAEKEESVQIEGVRQQYRRSLTSWLYERPLNEHSIMSNVFQVVSGCFTGANLPTLGAWMIILVFLAVFAFLTQSFWQAMWHFLDKGIFVPLIFGIAAAPGFATLVSGFSPLAVAALLLVVAMLFPRWQSFGRRRRSALNRLLSSFLMRLGIAVLVVSLIIWGRHESQQALGASTSIALFGVIALLWWAGIKLSFARGYNLAMLFWFFLTFVVAVASLSQFQLTFGQSMSRYLTLLERHLFALSMIGLMGIVLSSASPIVLLEKLRLLMSYATFRIQLRLITLGAMALFAIALLVAYALYRAPLAGAVDPLYVIPATLGGGGLVLLGVSRRWASFAKNRLSLSSVLLMLPGIVLAGAVFVTPEGGIWGLQPSEAAKTGLALYFAVFVARFVDGNLWRLPFEQAEPILPSLLSFLGLSLSFIIGSAMNFDMSPAAIILVTTAVMVLGLGGAYIYRLRPGVNSLVLFLVCVLLVLFGSQAELVEKLLWLALIAVLLWLLASAIPRRVNTPFTPDGLRKARTFAPGLVRRFKIWKMRYNGSGLLVIGLLVSSIAIFSGWAIYFVAKYGTIEALKDYSFELGLPFLSLPDTPLERILSYRDAALPALAAEAFDILRYPDLSLQVRESREIIAASGCYFSEGSAIDSASDGIVAAVERIMGWLNLCQFEVNGDGLFPAGGMPHAAILDLPEVQDDFAAAAVVALLGTDFGLMMVLAQAFVVGLALAIGLHLALLIGRQLAYRGTALFGLVFMLGLLLIFICQMVLSWGNVFGLLPVVGQPMTFVSFGASHHLFFALPLVVSVLLASSLTEALSHAEQHALRVSRTTGMRRVLNL